MNVFLENGYLDCDSILKTGYTFNIIIGARGTGKTYGFGKWLINSGMDFVYLRRTAVEIDIAASAEFNVFQTLADDLNKSIYFTNAKIGKRLFIDDVSRGFAMPLSTFKNARGFDASRIRYILFDEFIPEYARTSKISEASTFYNAYETMNRNRELTGADPIRCIFCANSNNIDNDFFRSLGIVNVIARMTERGKLWYTDRERGLLVININNSPVSHWKRQTALYKLTGGHTEFDKMALGNDFNDLSDYKIKPMNLTGFKPKFKIGGLVFYAGANGIWYGTQHAAGTVKRAYEDTESGRARFVMNHGGKLVDRYIKDKLFFETAADEVFFRNLCNV